MSGKFSASLDNSMNPPSVKSSPVPSVSPPLQKSSILTSDIPQISISADKLPSKGLPYPRKSIIQYRPYTFGEIKKVSQSKLDIKSSFDFVLKGLETPFDPMNLTVGDFFYLGLLRRISTLGSDKMQLPYQCGGCKKISKYVTETSNIDFEDMSVPDLPVIAEFNNREIEFNPLSLKGLYELIDLDKQSDEIALLAKQCSNVPFEEAYSFIDNANPEDSLLINEVDKLLFHSVKEIKFKCAEKKGSKVCGYENSIELDGGQALIMPFREHQESVRSKIHFGKPNACKPS